VLAGLCPDCTTWLTGLLQAVMRGQAAAVPLFGLPAWEHRAVVFSGQCQLCHSLPFEGVAGVECRPLTRTTEGWRRVDLCGACFTWLHAMATDGRSARRHAARAVDGPYGEWPHPNLRFLHVAIEAEDAVIEEAIREACESMDVEVCRTVEVSPGAILFFQVGVHRGQSPRMAPYAAAIAVAPLSSRGGLVEALSMGATDWLTSPPTPQQVTAALTRVPQRWKNPVAYDPFTALPITHSVPHDRPVLFIEPIRGTGLFELVWLLKRHSRGYDDLVATADGEIAFMPRCRPENLQYIVARLTMLLRDRCRIHERPAFATRRLDAAG
jgi:hypothetical protein